VNEFAVVAAAFLRSVLFQKSTASGAALTTVTLTTGAGAGSVTSS